MDSKKKMIIALSSFAMIILATVVAVVAVLAAQNVTIKSSINVSYTVSDVVADVEVYAMKVNVDATSFSWTSAQKNTKDFGIDYSGTTPENLSFSEFKLSKNECVVLKFVFNNNSAKAFTATLTPPSSPTNLNIYYASAESSLLSSTTTAASTVSVASGADKSSTYYAVIKIKDTTKDASLNAAFSWNLA